MARRGQSETLSKLTFISKKQKKNICTLYFVTTARTHKTNRESNLKILQEAHGQKAFRTTKHHREVGRV